jgi:flagellar basal body-associated protein FliL
MEPNYNQPTQPTPPGSYGNFNFNQEKPKKKFNLMIIPVVLLSLGVVALSIFLFNYNSKYQYQRDNVQNIANQQVAAAKKEQKVTLDKEYAEQSKLTISYL